MKNIILGVLFFSFTLALQNANAVTENPLQKKLVQDSILEPLINEMVSYKPVENHHFNLEAPQTCGAQGTIDKTTRVIKCQFHSAGLQKVTLSVCDNANTYCKQEHLDVKVAPRISKTPRIKIPPSKQTVQMQKDVKKQLQSDFVMMSPEQAKSALSQKKAALVMISTDWCPPCNYAKEFLLPTKEYKNKTKDLLLVYVDGDSPEAAKWQPYLKSYFYPTFVVLNQNLENVGLFTDIESQAHFEKLNQTLSLLDDPFTNLESRIQKREEGRYFQKFLDFFKSQESIEKDQERFLDYLDVRNQQSEKLKYMKLFVQQNPSKKLSDQILMAEQKAFLLDPSAEDPVEFKKKNEELTLAVLKLPAKDNDLYLYSLKTYCQSSKDVKTQKNSDQCLKLAKKHLDFVLKSSLSSDKNLSVAEKVFEKADAYHSLATLNQILDDKTSAVKNFNSCFNEYEKLYPHSPLKTKSRSVRFQQLYCLKEIDQGEKGVALLKSLAGDYPFEETFQRKLATHYFEKKNYMTALEHNDKAIKYSYGAMWAYNMSDRAKILSALNKPKEALSVLDEALAEIVLEKEDKSSRVVAMLREQKKALQVPGPVSGRAAQSM